MLKYKDHVCILKKTLYGVKQATGYWYSRLDKYLQQKVFERGFVDNNIYIKLEDENMIIILFYVYDIIFGSNIEGLIKTFVEEIQKEFDMSMVGELSFF